MEEWIALKKSKKSKNEKVNFSNSVGVVNNCPNNLNLNLSISDQRCQEIDVSNIFFLQDKISSYFHDGTHIDDKDPDEIESIEVLYDEEKRKYWAINNRSLYVLKMRNIEK